MDKRTEAKKETRCIWRPGIRVWGLGLITYNLRRVRIKNKDSEKRNSNNSNNGSLSSNILI